MFKVNYKETRITFMTPFWYFYCKFSTDFTFFFSVSIVNFEQVNAFWIDIFEISLLPKKYGLVISWLFAAQ